MTETPDRYQNLAESMLFMANQLEKLRGGPGQLPGYFDAIYNDEPLDEQWFNSVCDGIENMRGKQDEEKTS
jgi:hypothetical protein